MRKTVGVGLFGIVIAARSLALANTAPFEETWHFRFVVDPPRVTECERTPGGFYYRYEDVPEALKQLVPICWSYADDVLPIPAEKDVAPVDSALQNQRLRLLLDQPPGVSGATLDEALRPRTSRKR